MGFVVMGMGIVVMGMGIAREGAVIVVPVSPEVVEWVWGGAPFL
jgi:hypothetical protein